ncbi:MAG: hypothetical protein ACOCUI_02660 [bacterium]
MLGKQIKFNEKQKKFIIKNYKGGIGYVTLAKLCKINFGIDVSYGTIKIRLHEWGVYQRNGVNSYNEPKKK